jgi:methylmalonyl-CoA/ethylmalonyl-CoA epimerase
MMSASGVDDSDSALTSRGRRLHHVGIVIPSEEQVAALIQVLGLTEHERGYVERYQALCIFTVGNGGSPLELVVPDGGRLREFNQGFGGLHHVAIEVSNLSELTAELAEQGINLTEREPVRGAGAFLCNFLAPVYTRGTIVEFVQELDVQRGGYADRLAAS